MLDSGLRELSCLSCWALPAKELFLSLLDLGHADLSVGKAVVAEEAVRSPAR